MNGRLENEIKIDQKINSILLDMPVYVKEWNSKLKASQKTASSRKDYIYKIKDFLTYVKENTGSDDIENLSLSITMDYYSSKQTKYNEYGLLVYTSDSYQQNIWCALNSFFKFIVQRQYIEENYMEYIDKPKNHDLDRINENRILIDKKDMNKIIQTVKMGCGSNRAKTFQSSMKSRDMSIMLIFITTGIRKTALKSINLEDIDFDENIITIRDKGSMKGKLRQCYMTEQLVESLKQWIYIRDSYAKDTDALFVSYQGTRLSGSAIDKIVEKYCSAALNRKISPHKLRGGFISVLYNQTHDTEFCRRAVGHSNISTTQRYIVTDHSESQQAAGYMSKIIKNI